MSHSASWKALWGIDWSISNSSTKGIATPAQPVANFTSFVEIVDYNISVIFDWEATASAFL